MYTQSFYHKLKQTFIHVASDYQTANLFQDVCYTYPQQSKVFHDCYNVIFSNAGNQQQGQVKEDFNQRDRARSITQTMTQRVSQICAS